MKAVSPDLDWKGAQVPVSKQFDDPYYSLENGLKEAQHVFLAANGLPDRFQDGLSIAELGFGAGLNFLTTLQAWQRSGQEGQLHFASFEAYPLTQADLIRALQPFDIIAPLAQELVDGWSDLLRTGQWKSGDVNLSLNIGDARITLPRWKGRANCWYLDGFSPAKNPELWEADLLSEVFFHTENEGTATTYTAAGYVRRNLEDAGFWVERAEGYGRKRHMTVARKGSKDAE